MATSGSRPRSLASIAGPLDTATAVVPWLLVATGAACLPTVFLWAPLLATCTALASLVRTYAAFDFPRLPVTAVERARVFTRPPHCRKSSPPAL